MGREGGKRGLPGGGAGMGAGFAEGRGFYLITELN